MNAIAKLKKNPWFWFFCAASIFITGLTCLKRNDRVAYSELYGIWRTEEPRHRECYLVIDKVSLVIGAADQNAYVYFFDSVEKSTDEEMSLYTFHAKNPEGDEYDFWINGEEKEEGKVIYFKNQPQTKWTKVRDRIGQGTIALTSPLP